MNEPEVSKKKIVREFLNLRNENILLGNQLFAAEEIQAILPSTKLKLGATHDSIIALLRDGNCLTMGEIALSLELRKYEITKPVAALVRLGIVRRFQKEDNLRNVYVELTAYGNEIVDESTKITMDFWVKKIFDVLSKEELQELMEVIKKYNEFLLRFNR